MRRGEEIILRAVSGPQHYFCPPPHVVLNKLNATVTSNTEINIEISVVRPQKCARDFISFVSHYGFSHSITDKTANNSSQWVAACLKRLLEAICLSV